MTKSEKQAVYKWFYETKCIPDMGLYVKRIISGCKTQKQLIAAFNWGIKVISQHAHQKDKDFNIGQISYICNRTKRIISEIEYERYKKSL